MSPRAGNEATRADWADGGDGPPKESRIGPAVAAGSFLGYSIMHLEGRVSPRTFVDLALSVNLIKYADPSSRSCDFFYLAAFFTLFSPSPLPYPFSYASHSCSILRAMSPLLSPAQRRRRQQITARDDN